MKRIISTIAVAGIAAITLAGCGGASIDSGSSGDDNTLTVWNWGQTSDAGLAYDDAVIAKFEEEHPDVDLEVVNQPFDQYYTLLGSAIEAGTGPDVALFNGGTQMKSRASQLVDVTDELSDLVPNYGGWDAFSVDGAIYGAPFTLQGFPIYINEAIFREAGLDTTAPTTWDELVDVCDAILSNTDKSCFTFGNKEGLAIEFFLSGFGSGIFTPEEYSAWLDGDRDWESEHARQVLELWAETNADGWYNAGVNSTAMFMEQFDQFSAGDGAMTIGLFSQWNDFEPFIGDDLSMMISPLVNDGAVPSLSYEGGVGYSVLNADKKELGADFLRTTLDSSILADFTAGGQVVSDTTLEVDTTNRAAEQTLALVPEGEPVLHTALGADTLDLLHRVGQQLVSGDISVDDAVSQLAASEE